MRNLYIDFDGVILDTLPPVYKLAKQLNLDYKTQTKEMSKLFSKIDWEASGGIGIKFTKEKESNCKFKNITSLEEILDIFD